MFSSDAELVERSRVHPSLFAGLYERHGSAVRRYVARRVGSDAGEDLAAEVFVRAFRARERYRAERDTALPWLLGVANHVIADHRRAERRRSRRLSGSPGPRLVSSSTRTLGFARSWCMSFVACPRPTGTRCCWWCGGSCPTRRSQALSACRSALSARGSPVPVDVSPARSAQTVCRECLSCT